MEGRGVPRGAAEQDASGPSLVPHDLVAEDDLPLLAAVRAGDTTAMAALYERHYTAALRTARGIAGSGLADDLVSDAFTRVFTSILHGAGPDRSLRPYLATTIRHLYVDQIRKGAKELLVGEQEALDRL